MPVISNIIHSVSITPRTFKSGSTVTASISYTAGSAYFIKVTGSLLISSPSRIPVAAGSRTEVVPLVVSHGASTTVEEMLFFTLRSSDKTSEVLTVRP